MLKKALLITLLTVIMTIGIAHAEIAKRDGGDAGAMAKAQMMMRQLSQENSALEVENESLKKQLDSIEKKIVEIKADKSRLTQKLDSSSNVITKYKENTEQLRERIMQDRERMQELVTKFKELIAAFRVVEQEKAQLKTSLSNNNKEMLLCAENNMKLVQTNHELVQQYLDKGVWDSIKQAEPVTQLTQVEIEKMAQEYENTINLLKISISDLGQ